MSCEWLVTFLFPNVDDNVFDTDCETDGHISHHLYMKN